MNVQDTGTEIEEIGSHDLDEASEALLGFIYDFQNKLPLAINHYFAKKFGYDPDKRPIGFQVDFQKKKVHAMSPKMNREQRRKAGVDNKKSSGLEVTE